MKYLSPTAGHGYSRLLSWLSIAIGAAICFISNCICNPLVPTFKTSPLYGVPPATYKETGTVNWSSAADDSLSTNASTCSGGLDAGCTEETGDSGPVRNAP